MKDKKLSPAIETMINLVGSTLKGKGINIAKKLAVQQTNLDYIVDEAIFSGEFPYPIGKLTKEQGFYFQSQDLTEFNREAVENIFPISFGNYMAYLVDIKSQEEVGDFLHGGEIGFIIRYHD